MSCERVPEFSKELKLFTKKYRSLPQDLELFEKIIINNDELERIQFFQGNTATKLVDTNEVVVVKARLDCKSLGNKQILRVIYVYYPHLGTFLLVELFSKNDKPREDIIRYRRYLTPPN
jgi:hypothetical protein